MYGRLHWPSIHLNVSSNVPTPILCTVFYSVFTLNWTFKMYKFWYNYEVARNHYFENYFYRCISALKTENFQNKKLNIQFNAMLILPFLFNAKILIHLQCLPKESQFANFKHFKITTAYTRVWVEKFWTKSEPSFCHSTYMQPI